MNQDHKNWLGERCNLPLEELIAVPNCGLKCPNGHSHCPECNLCGPNKGYYKAGELIERFTDSEIEFIEGLFDKKDGFKGPFDCVLPRHLRSITCLKHICKGCKLSPYL